MRPPFRGVSSSQLPGGLVVARDQECDLGLDGIGVLELVDQDRPEPPAEVRARLGALDEQLARPLEQVVEVGRPGRLALTLVLLDELLGDRDERGKGLAAELVPHTLDRLVNGLAVMLGAPAPVRVVPQPLRAGAGREVRGSEEDLAYELGLVRLDRSQALPPFCDRLHVSSRVVVLATAGEDLVEHRDRFAELCP